MSTRSLDLDLRLVRYFTVLAEHEHFGRAADALHLAQPSLSRQIQRLEAQIGARLLDRTPRGSRLTEAGRAFLPRAEALLRSADRAAADARAATEPGTITVGYVTNLIVTPAVLELRRRHPEAGVATRHLAWDEPHLALLDHRVDVALARAPFPVDQLDVTLLFEERRVLIVSVSHRLAGRDSVTLADFEDEPLLRSLDDDWNAFWRIDPRPGGRRAPEGPLVDEAVDKFELIAGGDALAIAPAGQWNTGLRSDLTAVPIDGIAPSRVLLATRAGSSGLLIEDFRAIAADLLAAGG